MYLILYAVYLYAIVHFCETNKYYYYYSPLYSYYTPASLTCISLYAISFVISIWCSNDKC